MKKNIIKFICAICVICGFNSCMDFEPEAQMNDATVWNSAEKFQLFANQFYSYTRDIYASSKVVTGSYQASVTDGPHSDLRSDLCCEAKMNTFSAGTNSIEATDPNYGTLYSHIYYTNLLLKNAKDYATPEEIAVPVAEAKFFRAYSYFELVQLFGDAILVTEPLDLDAPELQRARNDRSEIIDLCISDLKEAIQGLPETPSAAGRLCKDAARGFLSRVALYEGTWQKFHNGGPNTMENTERVHYLLSTAKQASKEIIEGGRYKLFFDADLATESYRYMFILEDEKCNPSGLTTNDNKEYILARRHRLEDGIGTNITKAYAANAVYPTRKLANMYLGDDGLPIDNPNSRFSGTDIYTGLATEFDNRDNRMKTTLMPNGTKYWNNTKEHCRTAWDATDNSRALTVSVTSNSGYQTHKWAVERLVPDTKEAMDYPVIRYAEVLLNFAEATFEQQGRISDSDLNKSLNLVRQRVNPTMPKLTNAFVEANGLSMREEIRRERTVELVFEGFRVDDLKRWYTASTEMPKDLLGVKYAGTAFATAWTGQTRPLNGDGCILMYTGRTWAEKNYLYPLPSDQLQLNPNLNQNPGWE